MPAKKRSMSTQVSSHGRSASLVATSALPERAARDSNKNSSISRGLRGDRDYYLNALPHDGSDHIRLRSRSCVSPALPLLRQWLTRFRGQVIRHDTSNSIKDKTFNSCIDGQLFHASLFFDPSLVIRAKTGQIQNDDLARRVSQSNGFTLETNEFCHDLILTVCIRKGTKLRRLC